MKLHIQLSQKGIIKDVLFQILVTKTKETTFLSDHFSRFKTLNKRPSKNRCLYYNNLSVSYRNLSV